MASQFVGRNRGQTRTDVVSATSTQSKDVELRIDLTKGLTEQDIEQAITDIENFIRENRSFLGNG